MAPFTVSEHGAQISDGQCSRLCITSALIYQMQLHLLTVVELTRVLDASSRLERPALAPSVIYNHLHIVVMLVVTLLLHRSNAQ